MKNPQLQFFANFLSEDWQCSQTMSTCCFVIPLKAGSWIIAFLEALNGVFSLLFDASALRSAKEPSVSFYIFIALNSVILVFVVIFIAALVSKNVKLMLSYFIWGCFRASLTVFILILLVASFATMKQSKGTQPLLNSAFYSEEVRDMVGTSAYIAVYTSYQLLTTVLCIYFLKVKYDIYLEMKAKAAGRTGNEVWFLEENLTVPLSPDQ